MFKSFYLGDYNYIFSLSKPFHILFLALFQTLGLFSFIVIIFKYVHVYGYTYISK